MATFAALPVFGLRKLALARMWQKNLLATFDQREKKVKEWGKDLC